MKYKFTNGVDVSIEITAPSFKQAMEKLGEVTKDPSYVRDESQFPFHGYSKWDLMRFCFGDKVNAVDSAIPQELADRIRSLSGGNSDPFWYVYDYSEARAFGKLVNLKEKYFDVMAKQSIL